MTWTLTPTILPSSLQRSTWKNAIHVGHSTGGGEVARYIARHGTNRVAKAVLISAIPPLMLKTAANPGGLPISAFDGIRAGVQSDRSQFFKDLSLQFYGYNRPGAKISEGVRESFWLQGMMAGFPAAYFCIKAFSETDQTEDLKKIDVPTLILHGDDDQIVPYANAALLQAKMIKDATLKIYKGAPHGMCTTLKNRSTKTFWPSSRVNVENPWKEHRGRCLVDRERIQSLSVFNWILKSPADFTTFLWLSGMITGFKSA